MKGVYTKDQKGHRARTAIQTGTSTCQLTTVASTSTTIAPVAKQGLDCYQRSRVLRS